MASPLSCTDFETETLPALLAYSSLLRSRRRELHRLAAEWFADQDLTPHAQHTQHDIDLGSSPEGDAEMVSTAARSNMPRLPSLIVRFLTLKICARRIFDVTGQPPVGVSLPALQRARRRNLQSRLDIGKRPNCCSSSLGVGRTEMDTNPHALPRTQSRPQHGGDCDHVRAACNAVGVGLAYLFILRHRLPFGLLLSGWQPWLSTMATNVGIAAVAAGLIWLIGVWPFLLVQLPIILLAGSVGVWLFYVQHQFEMTFWAHESGWSFEEAALHGSSHYDLPGILRWFTANIGVHHVHHLQPHSVLPPAACAPRLSRASRREPTYAA